MEDIGKGAYAMKADFKMSFDDDAWGHTMNWLFHIADELYHNRETPVPEAWRFRPSPLGPINEPDEWETTIVQAATDEELVSFGNLLNRYARALKYAGKDY